MNLRQFPMRILGFLLGSSCVVGMAQTEGGWQWSNPVPHGNNIADLAYRGGRYVQVTDHGGIYISTNRIVWEKRDSGTRRELRGVQFLGGRLLITGEEGIALWSDDLLHFQAADVAPATSDWLEGVATSTNLAVAVGDNGAIYRSTDGLSWARVAGTGFSEWLSGVAFGNGTFVAVGEGGFIASSTNGTSWTRRNSRTTTDLTRVSFGGGEFVAVGRHGTVTVSADGASWTADAGTGTTNDFLAAAGSSALRLAPGDAALRLLRLPSRLWEDQFSLLVTPSPAPEWTYLASVWDGTRFVISGLTGVSVESLQTNFPGLQNSSLWFRLDDSARNWLWDAQRFDGTYLAVGDRATIMSSASGKDWALETSALDVDTVLYGIGGSPRFAIAVGQGGAILRSPALFTNTIVTNVIRVGDRSHLLVTTNRQSLLGIQWDQVTPKPTTNTLQGIGWNGEQFVVVGAAGTVVRSADGTNWIRGAIPSNAFFSTVVATPGGWVAGGTAGNLYTSPDAVTWTRRDVGTTNWIYRIRSIGASWIAVGQGGLLLVSTNGVTWTPRDSGTDLWLTDVRRVGSAIYVSGVQGTILRSTDLVTWKSVEVPTGKALYALATRGAQLIAAGAEGVVLRNVVEPGAVPVRIQAFSHRLEGVPVDLFLFEGTPEQRFRLEESTELGSWKVLGEYQLGPAGGLTLGLESTEARHFYRTVSGE